MSKPVTDETHNIDTGQAVDLVAKLEQMLEIATRVHLDFDLCFRITTGGKKVWFVQVSGESENAHDYIGRNRLNLDAAIDDCLEVYKDK